MSNFSYDVKNDLPSAASLLLLARGVRGFGGTMARIVRSAVDLEKRNHDYVNRTHNAEDGTESKVHTTAGGTTVVATMGVEYASYLNNSGHSGFEKLLKIATDTIGEAHSALDKKS